MTDRTLINDNNDDDNSQLVCVCEAEGSWRMCPIHGPNKDDHWSGFDTWEEYRGLK